MNDSMAIETPHDTGGGYGIQHHNQAPGSYTTSAWIQQQQQQQQQPRIAGTAAAAAEQQVSFRLRGSQLLLQ
jgi:hypothetical protein